MKKLLIIFIIFLLNSCQSSNELFIENSPTQNTKIIDQKNILPSGQTQDVYANRALKTIDANKEKIKIALFLPLSGKNRDLGQALYNSALMSLFDNDINHNLELVLIDSKDSEIDATKAFGQIVDKKIKIVIGPIFSNLTDSVKKTALRNNIKLVSLSNNQDLIDNIDEKGAVFIAGFLPEQQIDKVVTYAIEQQKINFAILAPSNNYGLRIAKTLKNTVESRDGVIVKSELYNSTSEVELRKSVKRVIDAFIVPAKMAEGGGNKLDKKFRVKDSDRTYADIIFIPESGKVLNKIAALIKEENTTERDIQLIGTGQWDDIATLNDKNLKGAWIAAPKHDRFDNFEKSYYQLYNKFPPRISSIVYDSVAAIAQIADKTKDREILVEDFVGYKNLIQDLGFEGIDGKFRFLKNGLVQRNFSVLQVADGQFEAIEEANEKFLLY